MDKDKDLEMDQIGQVTSGVKELELNQDNAKIDDMEEGAVGGGEDMKQDSGDKDWGTG